MLYEVITDNRRAGSIAATVSTARAWPDLGPMLHFTARDRAGETLRCLRTGRTHAARKCRAERSVLQLRIQYGRAPERTLLHRHASRRRDDRAAVSPGRVT